MLIEDVSTESAEYKPTADALAQDAEDKAKRLLIAAPRLRDALTQLKDACSVIESGSRAWTDATFLAALATADAVLRETT